MKSSFWAGIIILIIALTNFSHAIYNDQLGLLTKPQVLGGAIIDGKEVPLGHSCIDVRKLPYSINRNSSIYNVEYIPNRTAQVEVSFISDYERLKWEIQNTFQLMSSAPDGPGTSLTTSPIQFLHESEETSTNFVYTFKAVYNGGRLILKAPYRLSGNIKEDYPDLLDFEAFCGNKFVNQLILGAEAYVTVNIEVFKKKIKNEIASNMPLNSTLKLSNLTEVMENLHLKIQKDNLQVRVNISAIQRGGNAANIGGILGSGVSNCNSANFLNCISVVSNVASYFNKDNTLGWAFDLERFIISAETEVVRLPFLANVLGVGSLDYCCMSPQERPIGCDENACKMVDALDNQMAKITLNKKTSKDELEKIEKYKKFLGVPLHEIYRIILTKYEMNLAKNLETLEVAKNNCYQAPPSCNQIVEETIKILSPLNPDIWKLMERENRIKICLDSGKNNDLSKIEIKFLNKGIEIDTFVINENPRRESKECFIFHSPEGSENPIEDIMVRAWTKTEENGKCRIHVKNKFSNWVDWDLNGIEVEILRSNNSFSFSGKSLKLTNKCGPSDSLPQVSNWSLFSDISKK